MEEKLNIFGESLEDCGHSPKTGYYRDGCCNTSNDDSGSHTVCAIMTEGFLKFSKSRGNDLSSPFPQYSFPGLKPGDRWCLCALRFQEALENGFAPKVVLEATHQRCLDIIKIDDLVANAYYSKPQEK